MSSIRATAVIERVSTTRRLAPRLCVVRGLAADGTRGVRARRSARVSPRESVRV